jgi:hypothetical protein
VRKVSLLGCEEDVVVISRPPACANGAVLEVLYALRFTGVKKLLGFSHRIERAPSSTFPDLKY